MMSVRYHKNNEKAFSEMRKMDLKLCTPLQKASLDYLYSVIYQEKCDLDMALFHIQRIDSFYSVIPREGYMKILFHYFSRF